MLRLNASKRKSILIINYSMKKISMRWKKKSKCRLKNNKLFKANHLSMIFMMRDKNSQWTLLIKVTLKTLVMNAMCQNRETRRGREVLSLHLSQAQWLSEVSTKKESWMCQVKPVLNSKKKVLHISDMKLLRRKEANS